MPLGDGHSLVDDPREEDWAFLFLVVSGADVKKRERYLTPTRLAYSILSSAEPVVKPDGTVTVKFSNGSPKIDEPV